MRRFTQESAIPGIGLGVDHRFNQASRLVITLYTYGSDARGFFKIVVIGCGKSWGKWAARIPADNLTI